jgi:DNA polymerase-4
LAAVTVQVKVRYSDFTTLTRQVSMEEALEDASSIYRLSCWLLGRHRLVARPLRLIGVGVTGLRAVTMRQLVLPFMETRR